MPCKYEKTPGARNYQNYTKETLEKAAFLVKTKQISLRKAAQEFGIPKSTINNKVKGKHQKKVRGQTRLMEETENVLVNVIDTFAAWKMPLANIDVRLLVQDYLDMKTDEKKVFKDNLPGPDWIDGFVARHRLTERVVDNVKV